MTMDENMKKINGLRYQSFPEIFGEMRRLSEQYGDLPLESLMGAFDRASGQFGRLFSFDPYLQNRRVKGVSTRPANYNKDQIAQMIQAPESSEQPLRAVEAALEYSAYPLFHTRMTYQNLLTYHSYVAPHLTDREDAKRDDFWREWKLAEKLRSTIAPKDVCHMIAGQALKEGKVFYAPRCKVDKAHNQVQHAFLQQLPSDYVKIVGFNNVSKYTVAFNLMYFMAPGTDVRHYGDLFAPYLPDFYDALTSNPFEDRGGKVVYSSVGLNLEKVRKASNESVEAYWEKGRWFYWVTLPADRVFPFEIDDTDRNVLPVFTGLFIDFIQLAQMEQIQLSLLQNPLVQILTGEIPYWDNSATNEADQYKLSNAGRMLFESLWYQMLQANNTSGIGLYMAPLENMRLESLNEAPNATNIVSQGYTDVMAQAGLTALIPTGDEARAGAVQVSLLIESQFCKSVYRCFERMMNCLLRKLRLNYDWQFKMFGSLAEDEKLEKELKEQMTLGILPAAIEYNALHDRSLLDDISISDAVLESNLMDRRLPLVSTYSAKQENGLPPQGGRPKSEGITSDGQEQDADAEA